MGWSVDDVTDHLLIAETVDLMRICSSQPHSLGLSEFDSIVMRCILFVNTPLSVQNSVQE